MWNDQENIDQIVSEEFPQYYHIYTNLMHIMKIDIAKMVILYAYGGMYVDMDYYCYSNFFEDLNNDVVLTGSVHPGELVQNGMLSAVPRHPFILAHIEDMFQSIEASHNDGTDTYVKENTGPMSLSRAYYKMSEYHSDIEILDPEIYNPDIDVFYKDVSNLKCIHLLSGIWGRKDLTDNKDMKDRYEDWRGIMVNDI